MINNLLASAGAFIFVVITINCLLIVSALTVFVSRYKKCPVNKALIVYGQVGVNQDGTPRKAKIVRNGGIFVIPIIQSYAYLDLKPIAVTVDHSFESIIKKVPRTFSIAISTKDDLLWNAAERLLGFGEKEISELACDIIWAQLRLFYDEDKDMIIDNDQLSQAIESEINKIGLTILNIIG